MHSQKQILLMIVLAALVMRGPINAVGPMAPVVRDVFDLPWGGFRRTRRHSDHGLWTL